jgi:hypothetical protein
MSISIDFISSPRIITVLAPETSITMQELVNSVRDIEDELLDLEYDHILDASGKENLGGGVYVGVSVTLRNAKLAFEARTGPGYTQCNATGGNLVAVDEYGAVMAAIQPTGFTQVILTLSSSATLQESDEIQRASFNNCVTINAINGESGTIYPIGTKLHPVKTLANALTIAIIRGFDILHFDSDFTFLASTDITGYILTGNGMSETTLTCDSGSILNNCMVENAKLTGTTTGISGAHKTHIYNLNNTSLIPVSQQILIQDCLLDGLLSLPSTYSGIIQIINCWSDTGGCTIDFGGGTALVVIRGFCGIATFINNSTNASLDFDMNSGGITLDSTCTTGTYNIRGAGILVNNSSGSAIINTSGLLNTEDIDKTNKNATLIPAAL